jgi:hypothetical protein
VLTSGLSLAISAAFFAPRSWVEYAGADILIALTYAMIGVLLGPLVGRLGGLYLLLLLSIVDVGYGQTVMFHPDPPRWGAFLPARGGGRLLLDGAFTTGFEQYDPLLLGLGWLAVLTLAALWVFRRRTGAVAATALAPVTSGQGDGSTQPATRPSQEAQNCFMASSQEGTNMSSEDTQEATT